MSKFRDKSNYHTIQTSLLSRPRFILPLSKVEQYVNRSGDPSIPPSSQQLSGSIKPKITSTRVASVLIPLCTDRGIPSLLFIKRSTRMANHKGQVAFPGGIVDKDDHNDPIRCALRETHEEIGLRPNSINIIGLHHDAATMDSQAKTGKSTVITPVVGMIRHDIADISLDIDHTEVDYAFTVPLRVLLNRKNWSTTLHRPSITHQHNLLNVYPFSSRQIENFTYNNRPLVYSMGQQSDHHELLTHAPVSSSLFTHQSISSQSLSPSQHHQQHSTQFIQQDEIHELDAMIPGLLDSYRSTQYIPPQDHTQLSDGNMNTSSIFPIANTAPSPSTNSSPLIIPIPSPYRSWLPNRSIQLPMVNINITQSDNIWGATAHMTDLFIRQVIHPISSQLPLEI